MIYLAYTIIIIGTFALGLFIGIYKGQTNAYDNFRKLEISPKAIQEGQIQCSSGDIKDYICYYNEVYWWNYLWLFINGV